MRSLASAALGKACEQHWEEDHEVWKSKVIPYLVRQRCSPHVLQESLQFRQHKEALSPEVENRHGAILSLAAVLQHRVGEDFAGKVQHVCRLHAVFVLG